MKLFGSTKSNITKDKNGKNMPHLQINEVVQYIVILLITIINKIQESYIHLILMNHLVDYQIFHPKIYVFENY